MTLDSKWAVEDNTVKTTVLLETPKLASPQSPQKPAAFVSKWARDEVVKSNIPTPPTSASEPKEQSEMVSNETRLGALKLADRFGAPQQEKKDNKKNTKRSPVSPNLQQDEHFGHGKKHFDTRSNHKTLNAHHTYSEAHSGPHEHKSRQTPTHRNNAGHRQHEGKSHDKRGTHDEPGLMTAGAKALAMRIGAPAKKDGKYKPPKPANSKGYINQALSKQIHDQEPRRDDDISDAVKAEVQAMFDKMSDKSTSWADIEDED